MQSDVSQEDMEKANRILKVRIRNSALKHIDSVDARTLIMLENNNLFRKDAPGPGEDIDPEIVLDENHSRRVPASLGPLLVFVNEHPKVGSTVLDIPLLLYCEGRESREAAFRHLERMANAQPPCLTPRTVDFMKKYGGDLLSDDSSKWRQAAVCIGDVVDDDVLCSLAGLKQSLETTPVLKQSLESYGIKVLRPTVSSLDSIKLPVGTHSKERAETEALIKRIVDENDSLESACSAFFAAMGHIPLAPGLSFVRLYNLWIQRHGDPENSWESLWLWADSVNSPFARYHVCSIFVQNPDKIPEGKVKELWDELEIILSVPGVSEEKPDEHADWVLRSLLARHYAYHLEARLPDNDGASITCFAWWLAEQVAQVLSADNGDTAHYAEKWVKPELDVSTFIWALAGSRIKNSSIRYPTVFVNQAWSLALVNQMAPFLSQLEKSDLNLSLQEKFDDAISSNLMFNYVPDNEAESEVTYAFDLSIVPVFEKWLELCPEEHLERNKALLAFRSKMAADEGFAKALKTFPSLDSANQMFLAHVVRYRAYNGPPTEGVMWECLLDEEWREKSFLTGDVNAVELLFDGMMAMQVNHGEKWFSDLPHFMALICEKVKDNDDRQQRLFVYTLQSSISSDTVSAIERLMTGENKVKYRDLAGKYRQRLMAYQEYYPAWVKARIRPYLAVLSAS